ncbi:MAG: hypothetical protein H3C43_01860, partial [Leptonema sp. (in: Bacteria)]|nr:hypothetical protein [Leptonema sp. (in: bacteria)]
TNESVKVESVDVTLTMPAMSMPKNRIRLLPVGNGRFIGKGSIVRCLSGDRIWNSVIELNSAQSQKISADFQFEVEP